MPIYVTGADGVRRRVDGGSGASCPYRIGDILETENPTPPAESWPGTQWEELTGRFLLGRGDDHAVGTTGGEEKHALTVQEMPSHAHEYYAGEPGTNSVINWGPPVVQMQSGNSVTGTNMTGGSQPHNNMPPYRVVYIWKRTG